MIFLTTPRLTLRNVADRDAAEMFDDRNNEPGAQYRRDQVRRLDRIAALRAYLNARSPARGFVCFTGPENAPSRALPRKMGYTDLGYVPFNASRAFGKRLRPNTLDEIRQAVQPG